MSAQRTTIGMAHPTVVPENADAASANGTAESFVEEDGESSIEEPEYKAEETASDG